MAKVKSILNNIGVIKIYSHMGTTLHKRSRYFEIFKILLKTLNLFITKSCKALISIFIKISWKFVKKYKGASLIENTFENHFKHFEKQGPTSNSNEHKKIKTFNQIKEFEINEKIGLPGQKDKLKFQSLIFQILNGKKGYPKTEIRDVAVKIISPDLGWKTFLEGKKDVNLISEKSS